MRRLLFFFSFLISAFSFAQLGEPLTNNTEKKADKLAAPACYAGDLNMVPDCQGYVYSEFSNIEGREEEVIFHSKSGKPFTGDCKVCHQNGLLKMHLDYVNGRLVGSDTVYYNNGNINLITAHDDEGMGKENGKWKFYRPDGSLKWEKNYEMGLAQGEQRFYFEDSTIHKIEVYKDNMLHGKKQEYYPNNTLKKEIDYKNGKWNGTYITYFKDGKVESEQQYVNGEKDGPSSYYYENGELFYTENHDEGSREGSFKRMYATGRIWTVENYDKDRRDGDFEEYYDNEKNTIKYKATYKKGKLTYEMYYDEYGGEVMSPERIEEIKRNQALKDEEKGDEDASGDDKKKKKRNKK